MVRPGHMGGASVAAWGALVQLLRPSMARRRAIGYICSNFGRWPPVVFLRHRHSCEWGGMEMRAGLEVAGGVSCTVLKGLYTGLSMCLIRRVLYICSNWVHEW